jgi:hypothetical protein
VKVGVVPRKFVREDRRAECESGDKGDGEEHAKS